MSDPVEIDLTNTEVSDHDKVVISAALGAASVMVLKYSSLEAASKGMWRVAGELAAEAGIPVDILSRMASLISEQQGEPN